ncbi:hypothetical protein GFS24_04350 [Chitinophaga sp. SYP-B3965]|uniref:hypothetical protein n=1 Tax=Chitinophaga sp. SYP-B3965 TaxID=2663120 RepID=UPI00129986F2|nr:hypothetical protein [Chitinophaga sp. SYP-B3965]MRG44329.1 hypothetical protein [Chitinophaga sp. SYP-B3965]
MLSSSYRRLKPDTPGQLGSKTILDNNVHPPRIDSFQFIFDDWLGDDLIECFPCFLITERLLNKLEGMSLKGYVIKDVEIEFSPLFYDLNGNKKVPAFKWLYITGQAGDDFFIDEENCLMVSVNAYERINKDGNIPNCEVEVLSISQV